MSSPRRKHVTNLDHDLSPPRKNRKEPSIPASVNERKAGLISGKDLREEIDRKKKDDMLSAEASMFLCCYGSIEY